MKGLVCCLRDYVTKGDKLNAMYFEPDNNHWAYGDDIWKVKEAALRLEIAG